MVMSGFDLPPEQGCRGCWIGCPPIWCLPGRWVHPLRDLAKECYSRPGEEIRCEVLCRGGAKATGHFTTVSTPGNLGSKGKLVYVSELRILVLGLGLA